MNTLPRQDEKKIFAVQVIIVLEMVFLFVTRLGRAMSSKTCYRRSFSHSQNEKAKNRLKQRHKSKLL